MVKVDRRNEMADLDEDATDGQLADYLAAEQSGDHGAWNMGIVEYFCPKCEVGIQNISEEINDYTPLIIGWHEKAADDDGDCFSRFVFEYLAFIAHIKNNLFIDISRDRPAIQRLKGDERIKTSYLKAVHDNEELLEAWNRVIGELEIRPLHNSSRDPDNPEIDKWWNNSTDRVTDETVLPEGRVLSSTDWQNMVEFWYSVRNNLFHGGKNPNIRRDIFLVEHAWLTLRPLMDQFIAEGFRQ